MTNRPMIEIDPSRIREGDLIRVEAIPPHTLEDELLATEWVAKADDVNSDYARDRARFYLLKRAMKPLPRSEAAIWATTQARPSEALYLRQGDGVWKSAEAYIPEEDIISWRYYTGPEKDSE